MYGIAGLLTGRTLCERYRIEAVIGRGGMGAVYRAADERLGRAVAVKVIGIVAQDADDHARLQGRFLREAKAAAALHHPNVVSVHDFGSDEQLGLDFLVMELLHGEDLAVRLARTGPPPLPVSLSVLRQAARGLAAGHRAGLVHRDVKPGNLFLETSDHPDEPHVRVLDFGIAQVSGEEGTMTHLTEYGRSPFSPAYASPEQMRGDDRLTPASDVFSLAAVGYTLLAGTRAFTSSDPQRVEREVAEAVRLLPERAPGLSLPVREALVRALSIHPAARFADAAELADALAGAPVHRPAAAAATAPRPAPRVSFGAVSAEPDDEGTRVLTGPPPRTPPARERTVPPPVYAAPQPQRIVAPPPPVAALPQMEAEDGIRTVPRRAGKGRRFFRALWDFVVTLVVMALFVGAWGLAASGVLEGERDRVYAGAAATVLFTPAAIHRLTGRRGRYGMALFGSIVATVAAVYYVGRGDDPDPAVVLAAMFGLQVAASFLMTRLFRRRADPETYEEE
jgi:eukaryotic-like serine/threonine-protein kinase